MLVEFRSGDQMLAVKAIAIYRKGIEAAAAACEKVYVPTMELQQAEHAADCALQWVGEKFENMGDGEVKEIDVPLDTTLALRAAASVYLVQLGKVAEKQTVLLVAPDDTNVRITELQSLSDRLRGQLELRMGEARKGSMDGIDSVTISTPGHKPVTMTGKQFEELPETMERALVAARDRKRQ